MPTYQYACTACGERLEAVQSFTDPALTECPVCHGRLRKLFSPVGVVFKGSGFYKTDSRAPARSGAKTGGTDSESRDGSSGTREGAGAGSEPAAGKPAAGSETAAPAGPGKGSSNGDRPAASDPNGSAGTTGKPPATTPAG